MMLPQVGVSGDDAGAEERQDRFGENRGGADVGALHDQRRDRVRHQMPPHDLGQAGADRDRGFDIRLLARRQHHRAHQPRHPRNFGMVIATSTVIRLAPDSETTAMASRMLGIAIRPSITRIITASTHLKKPETRPITRPMRDREHGSAKSDQQRNPSAIDDARQHVAAVGVGAEPGTARWTASAAARGAS